MPNPKEASAFEVVWVYMKTGEKMFKDSKKFFVMLFVVACGATLWVGGIFFYRLHSYFALSASKPISIDQWEIEEEKSSRMILFASYRFVFQGKTYQNRYRFPFIYPNKFLAMDDQKKGDAQGWHVYFNPRNPHISALQKTFPLKQGIYLFLSLSIFFYFIWRALLTYRQSKE
jgi:hypothetical protein